jgi:hypothetical protein
MWDLFLILVGALIGAFVKPFQDTLYAPKLQLEFANGDRRFILETMDASGHKFAYLRVGIRNNGWGTARNVRILVTRLVLQTRTNTNEPFDSEVLDLPFANSHEATMDIPRDTYRIVDVCRVQHRTNIELQFLFLKTPNYFPRDLTAGDYRMTIQATADNCRPTSANVEFAWRGTSFAFR